MTEVVGGLRERFIVDSMKQHIHDGLSTLHWFDMGRQHLPVTVRTEPVPNIEEIVPNVVAIMEDGLSENDAEMGSNFTEFRWQFAIDVYAENDAVGRHLAGDIKAILSARFAFTDGLPHLPVYDFRMATPAVIFYCDFENLVASRQQLWQRSYQKFWWTILIDVVDFYGSE